MTEPRDDPIGAARAEAGETNVVSFETLAPGEGAGDVIDRYELVEPLGEGGMGTVWRARQSEPVVRDVALKVIKLGMDTREVVVRFEAERQALALMDHPHIAKVLDGGATASGRPFFVMELVQGEPITAYCDSRSLRLRARLELFAAVCDAVQHAHQKGVIHRDIKPSNVLVGETDAGPAPKIIDFGVAKATSAELTKKTLFTQFSQMIGTPEYMAPEQAEMTGLDVDTRADVYSLGVLLYEMLTGTKPFDIREALASGFDELLRTIREVDPAKPSTRISTLGDAATPIALKRHVNAGALRKRLSGDLDWIVMKALEKDRSRRYETASAFADDVRRYLADESVVAAPPSAAYRVRKFVARRRRTVAAAAAFGVLLVAGSIGTGVGWWKAVDANERLEVALVQKQDALDEEQRQRARAEENEREMRLAYARATEVNRVIRDMLSLVAPWNALGSDTELIDAMIDDVAARLDAGEIDDELVAAELHVIVGRASSATDRFELADRHLSAAREILARRDNHALDEAMLELGRLRYGQGRLEESRALVEEAVAGYEARGLGDSMLYLNAVGMLGRLLVDAGELDEGIAMQQRSHDALVAAHGAERPATLVASRELASFYTRAGRYEEAGALLDATLDAGLRALGERHPLVIDTRVRKAHWLMLRGELLAARELCEAALEVAGEVYENSGTALADGYEVLGTIFLHAGDVLGAEPHLRRCIELMDAAHGDVHPASAETRASLASALQGAGRYAEALEVAREAYDVELETRGEAQHHVVSSLALALRVNGRYDEAIELLEDARERAAASPSPPLEHAQLLATLGTLLRDVGDLDGCADVWGEQLAFLLEKDPRSVNVMGARTNYGLVLDELGRHEEAVENLVAARVRMRAELPPSHPWRMNNLNGLASAYLGLGMRDEALAAQRESLDLTCAAADLPGANPELAHRAAWTLFAAEGELRDLPRALTYVERAIETGTPHAHMYSTRAQIEYDLGRTEDAVASMELALSVLDPSSAEFYAFEEVLEEFRGELEQ